MGEWHLTSWNHETPADFDVYVQFGADGKFDIFQKVETDVYKRQDNYYTWIMMANNVIKQIDASDFSSLDATQRSYLGFAYTYRAMFYLDLVRLYEFKENTVTEAPELLGLGVPVVLPETTEAEAKNNPRAKVDDIYDKVIFPDLDNAEELLENYTAPDKYTISLALVYGLKRCV